jgi:hypothetical protein
MGNVYVVALSGPPDTRAQAEVALESAGVPLLPKDHHAGADWRRKFPDDDCAWLTCIHDDVNVPTRAVEAAGWVLRVHYPMPDEPRFAFPLTPSVIASQVTARG